jgi:hypothetical protein
MMFPPASQIMSIESEGLREQEKVATLGRFSRLLRADGFGMRLGGRLALKECFDEDQRSKYELALEELGREASTSKRSKPSEG